jgi:hypothetical protein
MTTHPIKASAVNISMAILLLAGVRFVRRHPYMSKGGACGASRMIEPRKSLIQKGASSDESRNRVRSRV